MRSIMVAILLASSFLMVGCSDSFKNKEQTAEAKPVIKQKKLEAKKEKPKVVEQSTAKETRPVQEATKEVVKKAQEATKKAVDVAKKTTKKVVEATKELAKQTGDNEMVKNVVEKVQNSAGALAGMVPVLPGMSAPKYDEVKKLFAKCAGCHGDKAQNKALGKSQIIAKWSAKKIENALKGYKAGTYGGAMKGIMQGQVSNLNDKQIKELSEYISKF